MFMTGLADRIGENLAPLTGPVPAALIVLGVCFIPILSPLAGPGIGIVLAAGLFAGEQIAAGAVTPLLVLPFLFALDAWIGGGFIPPGLFFGEDEKETLNTGIPAAVFTRLVLLPAAVAIACIVSFGL
jgi:PTS system glucitol/sorbitol-specific IIC component